MRCDQVRALFSEWQEQRLGPLRANQVRIHLEGCPACARDLQLFQATWRLLHTLPQVEPPADFVARTLAALPLSEPAARRKPLLFPASWGWWAGVGGVLAALLLMAGLAGRWLMEGPSWKAPSIRIAVRPPPSPGEIPSPSSRLKSSLPRRVPIRGSEARKARSLGLGVHRLPSGPAPQRLGDREVGREVHPPLARLSGRLSGLTSEKRIAPLAVPPYSLALARAERLLTQGRAAEAIVLLEQAPPGAMPAAGYRLLAQAYQASYRLKEALQAQDQARRLDPQGTIPTPELALRVLAEARALLAEGQTEEAAWLSQALLLGPVGSEEQQAAAVALLARCQAARRQPELEQLTLTRLAQQFPHSAPSATALWQVAEAQEQGGQDQEAAHTYQTLLTQLPEEKEEWLLRARSLKRAADLAARSGGDARTVTSQYTAARDLFKRVLRAAKETSSLPDRTILLEMAQIQEALQEKQQAIATYVELLQQHPNTDSARQAEARLEALI